MSKGSFELHQLRCFVAVAEELNFRRAAARLNMTQPPLSRQIMLLEDRIGLTLLERSNRSVRLTPAGTSFLASAIDLLQRAEYAVLSARQAARGEVGTVAMGFVPSAALEFVPRIVTALREQMPGIRFDPIEMMSYEIVEAMHSGRLDFGLTRTTGRNREIESIQVVREPFVLALPGGHRLHEPARVSAADLDGEAFIGFSAERGGFLRETHRALFATAGIAPRIVQEVSQTQTIVALVNAGLGVALVPRSASAMQMQNVSFRSIEIPPEFTSSLYLNLAPNRSTPMHDRLRRTILEAFDTPDPKARRAAVRFD
ncbi:LysR substrate-binding domain-containing protein [Vannielia litorea]|uniref:LysR substrate-binding domain-containing protein n=1 Tax=Vannielia litorea TaxID=1217970 RepID=UPI001BD1919D|nr:LysR substrate-binding domain-containing protein [Vannielia litorea]MBS8227207.1 LysR family transcriptional regulator [Vannielia litorea]